MFNFSAKKLINYLLLVKQKTKYCLLLLGSIVVGHNVGSLIAEIMGWPKQEFNFPPLIVCTAVASFIFLGAIIEYWFKNE